MVPLHLEAEPDPVNPCLALICYSQSWVSTTGPLTSYCLHSHPTHASTEAASLSPGIDGNAADSSRVISLKSFDTDRGLISTGRPAIGIGAWEVDFTNCQEGLLSSQGAMSCHPIAVGGQMRLRNHPPETSAAFPVDGKCFLRP